MMLMSTMKELMADSIRSSGWVVCATLAGVAAAYRPRDLPKMYFNLHLRRYARRLIFFVDQYVTIDIVRKSSMFTNDKLKSSDAYEEVKAYLTKVCSRDALEFCGEGTVEGNSFSLSLREGQEVPDHFRNDDGNVTVTVWWLAVPTSGSSNMSEKSCLRLMFPQRYRALIVNEYLPHVRRKGRELMFVTIDIVCKSSSFSDQLKSSDAYEEVKAYLSSLCSGNALGLCAEGTVKGDSFLLSLHQGKEVLDKFRDVTLRWSSVRSDGSLRLTFHQQHRELILTEYLPHVRREGRAYMFGERRQKLYTNKRDLKYVSDDVWSHIDFDHPSTFDTLAMPLVEKERIKKDLETFSRNKKYYEQIGKPWKRGYLLYGPPGTGKSTMIAAMANYLKYDIYDIELTTVVSNSDLRKLLVKTTGKSLIVIEDIDCSLDDFTGQRGNKGRRQKKIAPGSDEDGSSNDDSGKVTLSGLLNFIDGIWSAHSGERIVVLTTNFPDKLDPALIRRGRMDMSIEMSYCGFEAFKTLALNYLGLVVGDELDEHPPPGSVQEQLKVVKDQLEVVEITPADVAECLLPSLADFAPPEADVAESSTKLRCSERGTKRCIGSLIDELKKQRKRRKQGRRQSC